MFPEGRACSQVCEEPGVGRISTCRPLITPDILLTRFARQTLTTLRVNVGFLTSTGNAGTIASPGLLRVTLDVQECETHEELSSR